MQLNKLLSPRAMAVVGASEKEGFGGDTCRNILAYADLDHVHFVNHRRDTVFGRQCYRSLDQLPEPIDLVVICTPRHIVPGVLRDAKEMGAGGAVVFASGYSEIGTEEGRRAEEELKELCNELDMALMGPNCAGFVNYVRKVHAFAFVSEQRDRKGHVGVISQSGQLCLSLMNSPSMSFSYLISAGNASVVAMEDYLAFLVEDEATKVVGLYLEGITRPESFVDSLRKAALKRKPVVILKTGRSEKGSSIAVSHTGSLSGSDRFYDAVFKKFGVIRVNDTEELLATTQLLAILPELPAGASVAALCLSGGETAMCADLGETYGIRYPEFAPGTRNRLRELLPDYSTPQNPLDTTAMVAYDANLLADVLQAVMDDPGVDIVVFGYTMPFEKDVDTSAGYMTEGIEKVVAGGRSKPLLMASFTENTRNPEYEARLKKVGVPILPPLYYAFAALRSLCAFLEYDPADHLLELAVPRGSDGKAAPKERSSHPLSEYDSMRLLKENGINVPEGAVAASREEAVAVAERIGYPVVLKVASAEIPHKSDVGGVRLDIADAASVEQAFDDIMGNVAKHAPDAVVDGVFVQKMLAPGLEAIVGVKNDPQFGPGVLCGLGGIFVEIFRDTSLLPAPVGLVEAKAMIHELKALPLFLGARGEPELDVMAFADLIVKVAKLAADNNGEICELDINPVLIHEKGKGVCAADAVVFEYGAM